jgi:SSS family transporter
MTCRVTAEQPAEPKDVLSWDTDTIPPLPDPEGFAGMFAGVSGGALVLAGGANFPEKRPWEEGAQKVWYDHIFVLPEPRAPWQTGFQLPRPLGYGTSVDTDEGIVCIGGGDASRHYADVFVLRWIEEEQKIGTDELPPIPEPCAFSCGARIGQTIFVAGGRRQPNAPTAMQNFWKLDLSQPSNERSWTRLEAWPGPPRMQAVAAVQDNSFFLIGGVTLDPDKDGDDKRVFLTDCYRFDPLAGRWMRIADLPRPAAAAPSPAMTMGQSHFAVIGGDDGVNALRMAELKDDHPGFPPDVLLYHTITDTWIAAGAFPKDTRAGLWPPVTTNTTWWRDRYVIPSGEARPGVRTPEVVWAEPKRGSEGFDAIDFGVLAVYLAALVGMGFYFSRREKSTKDFFLGGHRVPWWAAGLSIFGTQLSAITFMAIPGKAYHTDWVYFLGNMMIVAVAPLVVFVYLPFYRRLEVTSAYEYLEKRFNTATRLLGSAAFILFQLGRMGIVLFLPAAALHTVTGMDVYFCILLMGALATLYTVLGGIEAVIWTDVLQVFVLLGGALLALVMICFQVDGGLVGLVSEGMAAGKFKAANLTWDITTTALWVVVLGKTFETLVSYTSDQTVVQRYLTTADEKQAARSIWTNAVLTIPASIIFFAVGTALWAFYRTRPELLDPAGNIDEIFPWFIAQQMPVGLAGLVIAGLFAAAMSSLDSSMNSMATAITTDFYRRFNPRATDSGSLVLARWLTVILGAVGTGFALYMAYLNSPSMWDQYSKIIGLFGGGLAGLFAVGIFTRRTTALGALVGFAASAAILFWVKAHTQWHFFLYSAIGVLACFTVGYLVSVLLPFGRHDLQGLTLFTSRRAK